MDVNDSSCPSCGGATPPRQRYCSDACQRSARNARRRRGQLRERACATCGELFAPTRDDARFCSVRCRMTAHRTRTDGPLSNAAWQALYALATEGGAQLRRDVGDALVRRGLATRRDHLSGIYDATPEGRAFYREPQR